LTGGPEHPGNTVPVEVEASIDIEFHLVQVRARLALKVTESLYLFKNMGRCLMPVTLINVFSVPKGKEAEFVQWWQDVKASITTQPGFISGKFHRSLNPDGKFNFINMALWDNEEVYWKAYEKSVTPMKAKLGQLGVEMVPALYHVVFEY
jgi:heme-degrading monooxygenase HmoA